MLAITHFAKGRAGWREGGRERNQVNEGRREEEGKKGGIESAGTEGRREGGSHGK